MIRFEVVLTIETDGDSGVDALHSLKQMLDTDYPGWRWSLDSYRGCSR